VTDQPAAGIQLVLPIGLGLAASLCAAFLLDSSIFSMFVFVLFVFSLVS
jgi:hypothetical protein